jgi:pSer/pThr/pTyr-binding forkhead associated (FHA) protein
MSDSTPPPAPLGEVEVQLLDTSSGRTVKSWTFEGKSTITIGRSPDQLVEVSDPYVSRNHANIEYRDGQWMLVSRGRNGIVVNNQLVVEQPVSGDVCFRLGMEGPTLRFRTTAERAEITATICFDTLPAPVFQLDETKVQNDVVEIADGDYFQNLQQRAKKLRSQRKTD